jgi:transcriptional regulator with XRE-family HTH domain
MDEDNKNREIVDYFQKGYLQWQAKLGHRDTIREFAKYLGVSEGALGHWMKGKRRPELENARLVAPKLGQELYALLGYLPPDQDINNLARRWHRLDRLAKRDILSIAEKADGKSYGSGTVSGTQGMEQADTERKGSHNADMLGK